MNKGETKSGLVVLCALIFIVLTVVRYANAIGQFFVDEVPQLNIVSEYIESCRILGLNNSGVNREEESGLLFVGILLKKQNRILPFKLSDRTKFVAIKQVCEDKAYVTIEYTALSEELERKGVYHVNQVVVPGTELVFEAAVRLVRD